MKFSIVKEIIDNWDPIKIKDFTPDDEYDDESKAIYKFIITSKTYDIGELSELIKSVFIENFGNDLYESDTEVENGIAIKLIEKTNCSD